MTSNSNSNSNRFTIKDRDIEGSPELAAQLENRTSKVQKVINKKGGEETIIKRA